MKFLRDPDFVYECYEFWFDDQVELHRTERKLYNFKLVDNKFMWYDDDYSCWHYYHAALNVPQEILFQEYDKWLNKKILE